MSCDPGHCFQPDDRCLDLALASREAPALTITDYTQVSSRRVGRTQFEYEFRITVRNDGVSVTNVSALVSTRSPSMRVSEPNIEFGDIGGGDERVSVDTIRVIVDRRAPFSIAALDFNYLFTLPRYLTEGGPLAPKDEPEFGEPGYSSTYYGKVDPAGERTNLADWKAVNGFNPASIAFSRAQYVNAYDLGFGRDMSCMDNGRAACVVDNYLLERDTDGNIVPGGQELFAASVAMERINFLSRSIVAFYVYVPADGQPTPVRPADSDLVRTNRITLDTEGPKSVPESCYACHMGYTSAGNNPVGGTYLPWIWTYWRPGRAARR